MDFEEFKENITKDVKACFDDRTGADSSVETHKVDKMNYSYEAMVVKPEGSDVGVSIDVNNLYEACVLLRDSMLLSAALMLTRPIFIIM